MIIKAPAKINLAINVLSKRPDGYHDIDIVSLPLMLHDSIEITEYPSKCGTFVTSDDTSLLCDESNLVYIAYREMKKEFNFACSFRIHIYKRIPLEAGLGGGSADAAAVIKGLVKLKKLKIDDDKLIEIAKKIGSDVPYCLFNTPSRIKGMGEDVKPISVKKKYHVLLIKPLQGLSTKDVYELSDNIPCERQDISLLEKALKDGDDSGVEKYMINGLQPAAIKLLPEIETIIEKLKAENLRMIMMSGSGSTVFALSDDGKTLEKIAKKFDDDYDVFLTTTM